MTLPLVLVLPLLLLFRQNRRASAWSIWIPVAFNMCSASVFVLLVVNGERDILCALCSYAIGWASVWLLTPYLKSRRPFLMFLKTFLALAAFSVLAFCPRLLGGSSGLFDFREYLLFALAVASLPGAVALVLAARFVRRRFGRLRYLFWVAVSLFVGWNACAFPFVIFASGTTRLGEYLVSILVIWSLSFGLMLPLLTLSFLHPFYRGRLLAFLDVSEETLRSAPPVAESKPAIVA